MKLLACPCSGERNERNYEEGREYCFSRTWGESKKRLPLRLIQTMGQPPLYVLSVGNVHIPMLNTSRMGFDKTDCV